MKVIAIAKGYDNVKVRNPGDVFDVRDGATASWFKKVEDDRKGPAVEVAEKPTKAKAKKAEPATDLA